MKANMYSFLDRLTKQSFKLLFRVCMIFGGFLVVALGRMAWATLTSNTDETVEDGMTVEKAYQGDVPAGSLPGTRLD